MRRGAKDHRASSGTDRSSGTSRSVNIRRSSQHSYQPILLWCFRSKSNETPTGSSTAVAVADASFPMNGLICSFSVVYVDGALFGGLLATLERVDLQRRKRSLPVEDNPVPLATISSTGSGIGLQRSTTTSISDPVIDIENSSYQVRLQAIGAVGSGVRVMAVQIRWAQTCPSP